MPRLANHYLVGALQVLPVPPGFPTQWLPEETTRFSHRHENISCRYLSSAPYIYYRNGYSNRIRRSDRQTAQLNRQSAQPRAYRWASTRHASSHHHLAVSSSPHQHQVYLPDTAPTFMSRFPMSASTKKHHINPHDNKQTRDAVSHRRNQVRCGCETTRDDGGAQPPASSLQGMSMD